MTAPDVYGLKAVPTRTSFTLQVCSPDINVAMRSTYQERMANIKDPALLLDPEHISDMEMNNLYGPFKNEPFQGHVKIMDRALSKNAAPVTILTPEQKLIFPVEASIRFQELVRLYKSGKPHSFFGIEGTWVFETWGGKYYVKSI